LTFSNAVRVLVLTSLSLGGGQVLAASGAELRLEALSRSVDSVEQRLENLEREYGHRRGLIGAHAADVRFENAVFNYLVGNYGKAATQFYTLVASEALLDQAVGADAEWYLAESLMEDRHRVTAIEAYQRVIDKGAVHPFFADSVRRQLEAYGYLKDSEGFYRVYNRYIVTGVVPTTNKVRYSMGKSFYHQGDWARAKSLFAEVSGDSDMYTRAQYFMGAILVAEGQLEGALPHFERVTQYMPPVQADGYHGVGGIHEFAAKRAMENQVLDLARLAMGRVYYELGDYGRSQTQYRDIDPESNQFADQLYELVWVYLKQDQWLDAINQIDIFLIAYPEHRYTVQLQLLLGHLHMRREAYERALMSYEKVVEVYGPIQVHLAAIKGSPTRPDELFDALVEVSEIKDVDPEIPAFAISLFADDKFVRRAVDLRRELERQDGDIEDVRRLIDQISPVLEGKSQGIGTFRAGRNQVSGVRHGSIQLRIDLVDAELTHHEEEPQPGSASRLLTYRRDLDLLLGQLTALQAEDNERYERNDGVQDASEGAAQRGLIAKGVAEIKSGLKVIRNSGRDSSGLFQRIDKYWDRAERVERRSLSVMGKLERAEETELRLMRGQFSEQMELVVGLGVEHRAVFGEAEVLAADVTRTGIGHVEREFLDTVMGADRGIVDVYWTRKATVSTEIERLGEERGLRSRELDERFSTIRQRMGQLEGGD